jgi:hypothetical protein
MSKFPKFSEWVEYREAADGKPSAPRKAAKKNDTGKDAKGEKSKGSRSHVDDLSADYKGHHSDFGEEEPFKCDGKGGKAVAGDAPK